MGPLAFSLEAQDRERERPSPPIDSLVITNLRTHDIMASFGHPRDSKTHTQTHTHTKRAKERHREEGGLGVALGGMMREGNWSKARPMAQRTGIFLSSEFAHDLQRDREQEQARDRREPAIIHNPFANCKVRTKRREREMIK